jgi:homocysteine S-methyltransferase
MALYRNALPQLDGSPFLADGGLETTLVFHDGIDLPCFAAFTLLGDEQGRAALRRYFEPYLRLAADRQVSFILDTATWRASADWGTELGRGQPALIGAALGLRDWIVRDGSRAAIRAALPLYL